MVGKLGNIYELCCMSVFRLRKNYMLTYLSSSIWASPAQTLAKTVNVNIPLGYSCEYLPILEEE